MIRQKSVSRLVTLVLLLAVASAYGCATKMSTVKAAAAAKKAKKAKSGADAAGDDTADGSVATGSTSNVKTAAMITGLEEVKSWGQQSFSLITGKTIGPVEQGFGLVELNTPDLKFKTKLGNPPFRGKSNTTQVYQIQTQLTDQYLKLYKIALPVNFPANELAYKEQTLADGRVAIPLIAYPIQGYYRLENGEIIETPKSNASHVKIDWSSREILEPIQVNSLLPTELFFSQDHATQALQSYSWYFVETVISDDASNAQVVVAAPASVPAPASKKGKHNQSSSEPRTPTTAAVAATIAASTASAFVAPPITITQVSIVPDETQLKIQSDGKTNLLIPVQWKSSGSDGVEGVQIWNQRKLLEADLQGIQSASATGGVDHLIDVEIDAHHFSFTIQNTSANEIKKINYSFLRLL